jgi:hypothetical protein
MRGRLEHCRECGQRRNPRGRWTGAWAAAARASGDAVKAFQRRPWEAPSVMMQSMHAALCGSRGRRGGLCRFGIPQVEGHLCRRRQHQRAFAHDERSRGMVSHNGTLGVQLLRAQQFEYDWEPGSRVVMHSDGLSGRWNVNDYPGLNSRHPAIIAGVLYRDFVRRRDDATIVVGCQR